MPEEIIKDENGSNCGYVIIKVAEKGQPKYGAIQMPTKLFIENLHALEEDSHKLTEKSILLVDLVYANYIYDRIKKIMYMVDPGKYCTCESCKDEFYIKENQNSLNKLIEKILFFDLYAINHFSVINKEKAKLIVKKLQCEYTKYSLAISEYLESELIHGNYSTPEEYLLERARYLA